MGLTLPLLNRIKYLPVFAFAVALVVGFMPAIGPSFTASRAFAFWPVFLIGWKIRQLGLRHLLDHLWVKIVAVTVIVGTLYLAPLVLPDLKTRYFTMRKGYAGDFANQISEVGIRALVILFAIVGALAILVLIPKTKLAVLTYLGTGSLYIYLLHPLILKQLQQYNLIGLVDSRGKIVLYVLAAVALALLLGSKPVRSMTRWLVQPRYTWPFKTYVS